MSLKCVSSQILGCKIIFVSLNFMRLPRVVFTPSVRGENDSKQSDEIQAKFLCAVWHQQDSNSMFKGSIGHVTS